MQLKFLTQLVAQTCEPLLAAIESGQPSGALGLRRAARLPVAAALQNCLQAPLLLLTGRADQALTLLEEARLWLPEALHLFFPEPTPLFYEEAAWGEANRRERLQALTTLAAYHIPGATLPAQPPMIIASARALMTRTMPRRLFLKAARLLKPHQRLLLDPFIRQLLQQGYEASNIVVLPGQFARRGGILDLWPPAEPYPARLEFFGDEIDSLRYFDPASQRTLSASTAPVSRLLVTPAREFLLGDSPPPLPEGKDYSEFHLPLLHPEPACLLDYLPPTSLVLIDDWQLLEDTVNEVEEQALLMRQEFIREGTLPADFPPPFLTWNELQDVLSSHPYLELGFPSARRLALESAPEQATAPESLEEADRSSTGPPYSTLADRFAAGPRFAGRLKNILEYLEERCAAGEAVTIVSRQKARLQELWDEQPHPSAREHPVFVEGSLSEGWIFHSPTGQVLHLLTDGELFGWRRPEPRRRPRPLAEAPESNYSDLQPGDYVVHVDHGIGRFLGLVERTMDGLSREYLCIEYADEAQLYVPIHQADRLTRYVGPDNREPTLSRLGSPEWRSVKSHVKEAVQEVAEELLELYSRRSVIQGFAFGPDTHWQQELEASFPYVETEDQLRVLKEVKQDMESPRPMDRLICGDVGYGKTEVALRAAFKAILDGKQVAILVPTTVLAQQHYNTFQQRLAAFPATVEMLSRFRTPQQQDEIVARLARGQIDIIIGTHRLLSNDVKFKDLGLLIIDEEQRFGVTHKEKLKQMRTEVDVLTLTATPIPRTLYMALSGIRDISTINTPPEERLPIVTHVGPYSPRLVRQAILRELERGGQVFFVHNRVQTIGAMQAHLNKLVPEARIGIAHGQMPEQELAQRMEQFTAGEIDVLLCTSIIESGLDIPNANTLIVDRADTFGLAQLYQLRGRVGRGAQRAYAYFFRHNRKPPTPEGRQRLETIAENTQLGAGFSIAMRDLEIRGAGDILGTRQHGHIAAVGFHLYTALLAESVRRLRQSHQLPQAELPLAVMQQAVAANVELPLNVGIPVEYVPDRSVRLGLYRRMADLRSLSDLDELALEFQDRFGPLPERLKNLFLQFKFKLLAEQAGLASVLVEAGQLALRFPENQIPPDLPDLGPRARVGKTAIWLPFNGLENWTLQLQEVLEKLAQHTQPASTVISGG